MKADAAAGAIMSMPRVGFCFWGAPVRSANDDDDERRSSPKTVAMILEMSYFRL